ncbi:MAG TPA: hypothetical protein VL200_00970 [Lacunisphaera sp.]|nr:hypothetical protein [Lacunisphaera sp.]
MLLLALAGCSTPSRETEIRSYERGYAQAVKEQYWIQQNNQRAPAPQKP